jgi:peptide-methionine (S)-S-oxide reductase
MMLQKIGFGGGCHWCTEAYFQCLKGVEKVEQGWISSIAPDDTFSEAVIVYYDPAIIPLKILIAIHLHTHAATKNHSFRKKYRSAVYVFDEKISEAAQLIAECQFDFDEQIITKAVIFNEFKLNAVKQQNYYIKNKGSIFCERYIHPKLQMIQNEYATYFKTT